MSSITVYPDANPETTTVDGIAARNGVDQTLTNIRAGAGNASDDLSTQNQVLHLQASTTNNQFSQLGRGIFLFDTSAIGSTNNVDSSTISFWGYSKSNGLGSPAFVIGSSSPASNTAVVNADYSQVQTTSFGSISYASYDATDTVYSDITLNASGLANISKTGVSKFSAQTDWDINNSFTGVWANSFDSAFYCYFADNAGTTKDPKLVVNYSAAATSGTNLLTLLGVG